MKLVHILKEAVVEKNNPTLNEIADSPYSISSPNEDKPGKFTFFVDYTFKTDTGRDYYIRFDSKWEGRVKNPQQVYNWATELTFFPTKHAKVGDSGEVGGENFGKILATVILAIKEFIKDYKPEYIFWKGILTDQEKSGLRKGDTTKRQRIYNALFERGINTVSGYKAYIGSPRSYLLFDGDIPIKNANDLFKYPEQPTIHDPEKAKAALSRFNLSRS